MGRRWSRQDPTVVASLFPEYAGESVTIRLKEVNVLREKFADVNVFFFFFIPWSLTL